MKTLNDIRKHFASVKKVRCLSSGGVSVITQLNDLTQDDDGTIWCRDDKTNNLVRLYDSSLEKLAPTSEYKNNDTREYNVF